MINHDKLSNFDALLGICGPDYLFDIAHEQLGDYCLAKLKSNDETAYIHNITIGNGIDKEYFSTAIVTNPQKKEGWYICEYTDVKDDGYDDDIDIHLFIPVIKPVKYIDDILVCDDKSPLLIFLCICIHDFGYTHVTSFEGSPLENVNLTTLIRSCARFDHKIGAFNLCTLTSADRWHILDLFLNNEITTDMISAWIDPYNLH